MTELSITREAIEGLVETWWEAPGVESIGDIIQALNDRALVLAPIPNWVSDVRGAMPRWGMEMCAHRWLEGLDALIESIAQERYIATEAGRCGHLPARVLAEAQARARGLERWLKGWQPRTVLERDAFGRLGRLAEIKRLAAEGMLALLRARLWGEYPGDAWAALVADWRVRSEGDALLAQVLGDYALVDTLENACGFMLLHRLDWALDLIGGDATHDEKPGLERLGNCNAQLRLMWQYDPERFALTRAYLWGLRAWLDGRDAAWLHGIKPDCTPAAIQVVHRLNAPTDNEPLRRWLVASLLATTLLWAQRAVRMSMEGFAATGVPEWAEDLPSPAVAL